MVKASTPSPDFDLKTHRIIPDDGFWFPESSEKNRRCKKYGITPKIYNELFDKQDGCCAICGIHQSELPYTLCIDHDHITGIIRGLLCYKCNTGIGKFSDKEELLERAINYGHSESLPTNELFGKDLSRCFSNEKSALQYFDELTTRLKSLQGVPKVVTGVEAISEVVPEYQLVYLVKPDIG